MTLVAGVDIGGTNMQIGVVDDAGTIVGRTARRTGARGGADHVVATVADGLDEACANAGIERSAVSAVGLAAAGAMDFERGLVLISPNLDWDDLPLRDLAADALGRPVILENDVNAAAWGEYVLGAGRGGSGDALGVWIGTGVGGGLVLEGNLHRGNLHTAGEIGHTVAEPTGAAGARTVEDFCSRTGMRRRIVAGFAAHPDSVLAVHRADPDAIGTEEICAAYVAGDPLTCNVIHEAADRLGVAIGNVVTMLALPRVFLGGGMTESLGAPWIERLTASIKSAAFPPETADAVSVVATTLAADAGLLGAALIARDQSQGH